MGRLCSQHADDRPAIGRQLACSAGQLPAYCYHIVRNLERVKREHNRRFVKGSNVLCLLKEQGVRPLYPLSGGVRASLEALR